MPEEFTSFPLRKDYPLRGRGEVGLDRAIVDRDLAGAVDHRRLVAGGRGRVVLRPQDLHLAAEPGHRGLGKDRDLSAVLGRRPGIGPDAFQVGGPIVAGRELASGQP